MTLICKDICRDLLPPNEYFEYGLWMPADMYREDSDVEDGPEHERPVSKDVSPDASPANVSPPPPAAPSVIENLIKEVTGGSTTATALQAADVVRKMGLAPSQDEIAKLQAKRGDNVTAEYVEQWRQELHAAHAADSVDSLVTFFRYYDKTGAGTLSKKQIKNLLKSFGEPLTDSEVDSILKDLNLNTDRIDYRALAQGLLESE